MMEQEKPIPHGTIYGYAGRGCHCDECKAASRDYARNYRNSPKGRDASRRSASRNNHIRQAALAWVRSTHPEMILVFEQEWKEKAGQNPGDMQ